MFTSIFKKSTLLYFTILLLFVLPNIGLAQTRITNASENKTMITVNDGAASFEMTCTGEFEITDDRTAIKSISQDGYFEFSKKYKGKKRKVRIEPDNTGNLIYEFTEGRNRTLDEAEGKRWLSEVLPKVIKMTNIGAKSYISKLYKEGGVTAVEKEIAQQETGHQKAQSLDYLMDLQLSEKEFSAVIDFSTSIFSEDHYYKDFLEDHLDRILKSENGTDNFLDAVKSLKSDHYKNELLEELVESIDLNESNLVKIFEVLDDLDSDHYVTEVVQDIADQRNLTDKQLKLLIEKGINSVNSGHYKSEILDDILDNHKLGPESFKSFLTTLSTINSGHHMHEIIDDLVDSQKLSEQELTDLILTIENISSDHFLAETLMELADEVTHHKGTALDAYIKVAKSMNSNHYYREVMEAIE